MSVQGVIATVSTPAVISLSQLLTIARSGISRLAVWDVDRLKIRSFQRIGGACVRIAHESLPWSYYNSAILSRLLAKYEAIQDAKALALIKKVSPAAWRHVHLNGHYTFRGNAQIIDLDVIVADLNLA